MLNIPHSQSSAAERVTVSLGVSTLRPGVDNTPERGITMADEALYEAKEQGRNCSVIHQTDASLAHSQSLRKSAWQQPATA